MTTISISEQTSQFVELLSRADQLHNDFMEAVHAANFPEDNGPVSSFIKSYDALRKSIVDASLMAIEESLSMENPTTL